MKTITALALTLGALVAGACSGDRAADPIAPSYDGSGSEAHAERGFQVNGIARGAPTGAVFLNGGGSFAAVTATDVVPTHTSVRAGGDFRCIAAVQQGPLNGCAAGEGIRWHVRQLLATTTFKCTGADLLKTAATGPGTLVLLVDFFRAGDGNTPSFTAKAVVSATDIAADVAEQQTLWVQGAGCGNARVRFAR